MENKVIKRQNAEKFVEAFENYAPLLKEFFKCEIRRDSNYIIIRKTDWRGTCVFITKTQLDIISSIALKNSCIVVGVGIGLDGNLQIQLDPQ